MDARTDQVRRDIEQIRGDLGQTLEALGDRVAPGKVAARTKEMMADKVEDVRERVSPSRALKRQSRKLGDGLRSLMGSDDDGGAHVTGKVNEVAGRAAGVANAAADAARSAPQALQHRATGNPLAFGLVTFAGGFLLASILPPTEREQQVSRRIKDGLQPAVHEAVERGRAVAGELGQSVEESLEAVQRTARDAAERVKGEAVASAEDLKAQAQVAASEVKDEVQDAAGNVTHRARQAASTVSDEAGDTDRGDSVAAAPPEGGIRASTRPRPLRAPSRGGQQPGAGSRQHEVGRAW